jgi:hypothetical protein
MARATGRKPREFVLSETPAVDTSEQPTTATQDAIDEMADEGQRPPEARIHRTDPTTRKPAFLDAVDAGVVDEAFLSDNYGGGQYTVSIFGTKKDGSYGYLDGQRKRYSIDESKPFKGALRGRVTALPAGTPAAPNGGTPSSFDKMMDMGVFQLFKGMQDQAAETARQNREHSMAMATMMERIAKPQESQLPALLAVLTPLLTPLLAGMTNRPDPIDLATKIAALQRPGAGIGGLGELENFLELADRFNRKANGEDITLAGVLKDTLPVALETIGKFAPAAAPPTNAAPARLAAPAAPAPELSTPAVPTPPAVPVDEWTPLEPHIPQLIAFAENDSDPHGVCMTILTMAPTKFKAMLRELVARDDALALITGRFPAVAAYPTWMGALLDELAAELLGDDDTPANPSTIEAPPA